jgi:capsular exopolysaccharide synthesis family protein
MESQLDLRRYFLVMRRWLWLIIGCAVLAAVSAYVVSSRMTPVYKANMSLWIKPAPTTGTNEYAAILTSEREARTFAEMLTEQRVLEAVVDGLGLTGEMSWRELAGKIDVSLIEDTQLIRLSVEDTDRVRASELANSIGETFIAQTKAFNEERFADSLNNMQAQLAELSALIEETQAEIEALGEADAANEQAELTRLQTALVGYRNSYADLLRSYEEMRLTAVQSADDIVLYTRAEVPGSPIRPRPMMNTALAGAVGAMLAVGVAFLVEYLDDTIKDPDDVTRTLGLGTLGIIGQVKKNGEGELVTVSQPLSPVSEAFRVLRTNIRYSGVDKPLRTLLVTSAGPTEGKSVTVANLGVAMAQAGLRVAVVDADLRRPRLHKVFGVHPRGGLTGSLLEGAMDGRLQPSKDVEGLVILPAGGLPPNPAELLGSQRFQELLATLTQHMDVVLVDSPPILPVTDAAVLARGVDGVLLVIDAGETRREVARRAVDNLRQVGAHMIGVVLNRVPTHRGGYYYYYQEYYGDGGRKHTRTRRERSKAQ